MNLNLRNKFSGNYLLYCEFKFIGEISESININLLRPNLYRIESELDYNTLGNLIYNYLPDDADILLFKIENGRVYY